MGNFFSEFSAWGLDTAYVKWTPSMVPDKMLTALFGKVSNPMVVSKVNYDGDVRPEGAFLQLHLNKKGAFQPFATGGVMFISEHSSDPPEDAYAWVGQVGVKGKMGPAKFTLAAGLHRLGRVRHRWQTCPRKSAATRSTPTLLTKST